MRGRATPFDKLEGRVTQLEARINYNVCVADLKEIEWKLEEFERHLKLLEGRLPSEVFPVKWGKRKWKKIVRRRAP